MEIEQSHIHLEKRIINLEAQCEQLKEDKNELMEQVMRLKAKEENVKDKYAKWKMKFAELKEKFDSEVRKWKEEVDKSLNKYRQLEVEKRKLEIDFKATQNGDEQSEKLRAEVEHLKILLEDAEGRIWSLVATNDLLERHCGSLEKDFQAKLAMEAKKQKVEEEKKILELCQMSQDLESNKGGIERICNELVEKIDREISEEFNRILNENVALKEERKKKTLDLILRRGVLEEMGKLEEESRKKDEKIMELMQEKELLAAKKKKMMLEMNRRALKPEGATELPQPVHPTSNLAILDTLTQSINQGNQDSKNEDNTMAASANDSMGKRPSPENMSGGDSSTAKRTRSSV